jgi:hypothetical protein
MSIAASIAPRADADERWLLSGVMHDEHREDERRQR